MRVQVPLGAPRINMAIDSKRLVQPYRTDTFPVPVEREYKVIERIPHMQMADTSEATVTRTLAIRLAELIMHTGSMDCYRQHNYLRFEDEFMGRVFVFNEKQMQDFIREVEDAVKERLAQ